MAEQARHPAQQVRVHHVAVDHVRVERAHCARKPDHSPGVGDALRHAEADDLYPSAGQLAARRPRDPAGTRP